MAERRMFTKKITDGDAFTSMPPTSQCLYFHLCMSADDDGFSNNIRIALFNAHATMDDFNNLINKKFIIPFESGVIVIKHWKMHNLVRNDRYHETKYIEEMAQLVLKDNGVYSLDTNGIPNGYQMETEVRLGKVSIGKDSIGKDSQDKVNKDIVEIVDYLNIVCGTNYKSKTKNTVKHINARLSDGYTVDDFKTVIDKKATEWLGTEMEQYLRPDTLFGAKFESYLNQNIVKSKQSQISNRVSEVDNWV